MLKAKSMTILGVRGLRVHPRTPAFNRIGLLRSGALEPFDAAVQAMLWERSRAVDRLHWRIAVRQHSRWNTVFDRAMKRYEKAVKR